MNIVSDRMRLVIGLGDTGWSVAQYLHKHNLSFMLADTRLNPPHLAKLKREMPEIKLFLGELSPGVIGLADEIILSPGISLSHPLVAELAAQNKNIISDIQLWRRTIDKPLIAISGSNGKSTVVSLLAHMAKAQAIDAEVGGNLGKPVLAFSSSAQTYIIEISSFQLDITTELNADIACLLNVTPDHMERYDTFMDYYKSKQKIFNGCRAVVYNKQEKLTRPLKLPATNICFSSSQPDINEFGIITRGDKSYLSYGVEALIEVNQLKLIGEHNHKNILAALAVAKLRDWDLETCVKSLSNFTGLPHRCQLVGNIDGVTYINDSKATNPEATSATLQSMLRCFATIHLILGGSSKKANFTKLAQIIAEHKVNVYLLGEEGERINQVLPQGVNKYLCNEMPAALELIKAQAKSGDMALLSPGCASFDAYDNFATRGDDFIQQVKQDSNFSEET